MRRSASAALRPHMPSPPSPPALLTAAASAGVLALPIGACRIGHLRFSRSVSEFDGHIASVRNHAHSFHQHTPLCRARERRVAAPTPTLPRKRGREAKAKPRTGGGLLSNSGAGGVPVAGAQDAAGEGAGV